MIKLRLTYGTFRSNPRKITDIKAALAAFGCGLTEAKDIVENAMDNGSSTIWLAEDRCPKLVDFMINYAKHDYDWTLSECSLSAEPRDFILS